MTSTLHVGILAGESSGDILGAGLMQALRELYPDISFRGVGGPLMMAQGLDSQVPMERLSVMGLVEPLKRLPELLRIRRNLLAGFIADPPDVFIGIDSPDFNLGVEARLRAHGIRTVHYVSPSVWAWRQGRIRKIAKAADLVLTLFPFESDFYQRHQVPVCFVGHPLADLIPLEPDRAAARAELGLPEQGKVLALLPGSRQGELARMGPVFVATARQLLQEDPDLTVLMPCANADRKQQLLAVPGVKAGRLLLLDGQSRIAMTAADAVILASGTAALEAMLLKRPMLVCYKLAFLSYQIISRMLKVPWFSLPNLLSGRRLVEELVQDEVSVPTLVSRARDLLHDPAHHQALLQTYRDIHLQLRQDASRKAAKAIKDIL
jgi:lipid-A-disaccharide synthase